MQNIKRVNYVHFLESGCTRVELFVGVLVAEIDSFRVEFVSFLLVTPIHLKHLFHVTVSSAQRIVTIQLEHRIFTTVTTKSVTQGLRQITFHLITLNILIFRGRA